MPYFSTLFSFTLPLDKFDEINSENININFKTKYQIF